MHLSAADHVGQNSSAHMVRSAQMHLAAIRLNWNGLDMYKIKDKLMREYSKDFPLFGHSNIYPAFLIQ